MYLCENRAYTTTHIERVEARFVSSSVSALAENPRAVATHFSHRAEVNVNAESFLLHYSFVNFFICAMTSMSSPSTSKRKRNVLTVEKKLEILTKLDKGETHASLSLFYGVGKTTITDIKKNRDALQIFASTMDSGDGVKKRKVMKNAKDQKLDDAVSTWFTQRRNLGEPISGPLLCEKSLELNKKLGGSEDFKASPGWLHNFKSRHGIRELQIQGETLSANSNAAKQFKKTFQSFLEEEGLSRDDVYNADETGLNWKSLPRKSLASRQESAARGFKVSKERVTAMTCANAAGTHRLPLLLIGKSKKPRCFKNVTNLPVTYKAQKSAWMDAKLFVEWYTNDFIKTVKKWRQANKKTGKVLLLLDNAPSHPSAETLNSLDPDFQVMYLPPNVTSLIQPMDQGVIEKLKRMYRKQVLRRLLLDDGTEGSVVAFSKALNLKHCCYMIADAWDSLTEDNLRNAWKKLWHLPEEPEVEGETVNLETNDLNEFVDLFSSIPGFTDCDRDDAVDWLNHDANDPGYQIFDDDEIVSSLKNPDEDHDNDSSSNESVDAPKKTSHAEAFAAFETGLEWFERQEECCPTQLLLLKRLRDLAAQKRVTAVRQLKIDSFIKKI